MPSSQTARELVDHAERISPGAYWELLMNLTKREVKGRYSQSFFGVAWAIAQPLATMAVFTLVFSRLAKMPSMGAPYPLFAFAALVPWFFFMNSVSSGTLSLITYRNIVTKTYFPREIIPLAQVCSRFIDFFAAAALYAILMIAYGVHLGVWSLMAPVFFLLLILFTVGLTFATSADQRLLPRRQSGRADRAAAVAVSDAGRVSAGAGAVAIPAAVRAQSAERHRRGVPRRRWCSTARPTGR